MFRVKTAAVRRFRHLTLLIRDRSAPEGTRCSPQVERTANTFIRSEIQPRTMTGIVYECIECRHRVHADEGEKPASLACPKCRGVMKRLYL
jgi:DNA-directed RNA polymerase subunit RPC12/RpoP